MKRLSILFFALTIVLGQVAAKSINDVQEEPDSITALLNQKKEFVKMQISLLGSSEEQVKEVIQATDNLIALKYGPADPEVCSAADEAKVDSVEYFTNLIDSLDKKIEGVDRPRIDGYELLYLKLVNDFIDDGVYSKEGLKEAQELVARVRFNEAKANFKYLTDNYYDWLTQIAQICKDTQKDCVSNRQHWKNLQENRAALFISRLDNCGYMIRPDKDWAITYLDNVIVLAKQRIQKYLTNPDPHPTDFKGILPDEFLPSSSGNKMQGKTTTQNPNRGQQILNGFQGSNANADDVNGNSEEPNNSEANEEPASDDKILQDFRNSYDEQKNK